MTTLTPKQEAFCLKYIELGNASEAYRQAYNAENMKPESVHRKAAELLADGKITARIEALQAEHMKRHNLTVDKVITDLLEQCAVCMGKKSVKTTITIKNNQNGEIKCVEVDRYIFEAAGANKALELLGKHLGMFKDRVDHTITPAQDLPPLINLFFTDEEINKHKRAN